MKNIKFYIVVIAFLLPVLGLLLPSLAAAQLTPPNNNFNLPGNQSTTVTTEITNIIRIILAIVGLVAVGFLIWGGFRYITSAGNEEAAESAKKTIQNAIIGLVIIVLSYIIVTVIINAIGIRGQV